LKIKEEIKKVVRLEYKSLVTKEITDHYLSIIKDEKVKKDFINTISKFDIRIATKPVIKGEEFYYKIWILRRGTKKRAHIKLYNKMELLKKEEKSKPIPRFIEILNRIRLYANVPDDFEEYCEITFRDPSDQMSRTVYPAHLKKAKRFKKFVTTDEIRSIPFLPFDNIDKNIKDQETYDDFFDLDDESNLAELPIIYLKDKGEYDKLAELQSNVKYHSKIVKSYGYDIYTGDIDTKKFPTTKDDKEMDNIANDFKNYFKISEEYIDYLKELIKKYDIKPPGNLVQWLSFHRYNNHDNNSPKQPQDFDLDCIMAVVDWKEIS
jgi:hypothetical protein